MHEHTARITRATYTHTHTKADYNTAANWPLSATANGPQSRLYFLRSLPLPSPPQHWQLLPNEAHSLPSRPCDNEALPRTAGNQGAMSTARSWPPEQACFPSFTERAKAAPHCLGGERILASGNCPCPILKLSWNSVGASRAYICAYSWMCTHQREHTCGQAYTYTYTHTHTRMHNVEENYKWYIHVTEKRILTVVNLSFTTNLNIREDKQTSPA